MKKTLSFVLALCLVIALFCSLSVCAAADVRNEIKTGNSQDPVEKPYGPSHEDIRNLGDDKVIQLPSSDSYLDEYVQLFVKAPKGHSVYVYTMPDMGDSRVKSMPFAYHGVGVYALAVEGDYVCAIYPTENNDMRAGWFNADNLVSSFPGISMYTDSYGRQASYSSYFAEYRWSKLPFVNTKTKYTEIVSYNGPRAEADGIILEYQVISRNGIADVSGTREVYINDGSGWDFVGSYELGKDEYNVPTRLTIIFDRPMEIKAVATITTNPKTEGFVFRQFVTDVLFRN